IVRELLLRQRVKHVVVSAPASVVPQWRDELLERFGLDFAIVDRAYMTEQRKVNGFGVNPWTTHSHFVISHALLRDEAYAEPLRTWLGNFKDGSMLILDEAHHAAPASGQGYAVDSQLTRSVRELAARFEHRLFLTATPHNGHSNSFAALLEILDPLRFCRGVPVRDKNALDTVMVRRLKRDLMAVVEGFPERKVIACPIENLSPEAPELALAALLSQYLELRSQRFEGAKKRERTAAKLVATSLQKRLLSSLAAFDATLKVHHRGVLKQVATEAPDARRLSLVAGAPGADDEAAALAPEALEAEAARQMEAASSSRHGPGPEELALLERLVDLSGEHRHEADAKIKQLLSWINTHMREGGGWGARRLLIFTEYTDTQRYILEHLSRALGDAKRLDALHGGSGAEAREEIKRRFNADPQQEPLRILVATDAAREGLNLQAHCADLFHFDLPWNPGRLEQRNGRIDRKLQPASEVRCHYFVYTQRIEDRVLETLVRKTETIREELGSMGAVVDAAFAAVLDQGIRRSRIDEQLALLEKLGPEPSEELSAEFEDVREVPAHLAQSLTSLQRLLERSREQVGLDERAFKLAIDVSLERLGAPGLLQESGDAETVYRVPDLARLAAGDKSWESTIDALRPPRPRGEKLLDWRRTAPVRPVVFTDTGRLSEGVVHLHLEHRLVRRLFSPFLATGYQDDTFSRAVAIPTDDGVARVVLVGRLALYGLGASRLHDELIMATARWSPEGLTPYAEDADRKTIALLRQALADPKAFELPEPVLAARLKTLGSDVAALRPTLEAKADKAAEAADLALKNRGKAEADALAKLLQQLQDQLRKQLRAGMPKRLQKAYELQRQDPALPMILESIGARPNEAELRQLIVERRQFEADVRFWEKRIGALETEKQQEPEKLRLAYTVRQRQLDPVGVIYLVPRGK
ncbi:MAG: DISARM system SNF2-like helicase DrmD, partial [Candidatus Sericytochromatia bacterium]